jgi:AAA+ superfamily predicted ATPase
MEKNVWENIRFSYEEQSEDRTESRSPSKDDMISDYHAPIKDLKELFAHVPMKYSDDIKQYFTEINAIIPALREMRCISFFWKQNILLSLDDGYGVSAFLAGLLDVYIKNDLISPVSIEQGIKEIAIQNHETEIKEKYASWDAAVKEIEQISKSNHRTLEICAIVCLDISQWIDELHTERIVEYLKRIRDLSSNFICVFRIPFVERHMADEVAGVISDVMNIRNVFVPPVSMSDMVDYISETLKNLGYQNTENCNLFFEDCIINERRDNSFYGYKTLDKIVASVIYEQALVNVSSQKMTAVIDPGLFKTMNPASDESIDPGRKLESLIGMQEVKRQIEEIVTQIKTHKRMAEQGKAIDKPSIHMIFTGNPGTGKTTVARLVAEIFKREGILSKGRLHEIRGRDLCGRYIGETAPKTSAICRDALGSVLFIDEAYSLFNSEMSGRDYGREALDTLIAEMENHRDDLCIILAGYTQEMNELLKGNIGLESRIKYQVEFHNYSNEELESIFFYMVDGKFTYDEAFRNAVHEYFQHIPKEFTDRREFSNARFVRNLFERVWGKAAYRCNMNNEPELALTVSDFESAVNAGEFAQFEKKKHRQIGFAI